MKPASFGTVLVIGLFCLILTTTGCPPSSVVPNNGGGDSTDVVDGGNGDGGDNGDTTVTPGVDSDGDGVVDEDDNCPTTANADQADADGDGTGDACEADQGSDGGDGDDDSAGNDGDGDIVDSGDGDDGNTVDGDGDTSGDDGGNTGGDGDSTGNGGGNGDGTGNDDGDGGVVPDAECTLAITGLGSNPGSGSGVLVEIQVDYEGPEDSFVTFNPDFGLLGVIPTDFTPDAVGGVNLECKDEITLGLIFFTDATGFVTSSDAELTLQRGVDYACGSVLQLSFSLPCSVDID